MMSEIEIVFPVLNEEKRLRRGIEETVAFCARENINACYTIADNGSSDGTLRIADELAQNILNLKIISVGERGVGLALKTAWLSPRAPVVGYMDIDLATDLKHLKEVQLKFKNPDVSVLSASRLLKGAHVENRTLLRGVTSRVFNKILKLRLGVRFSDGMCGFKFIRADLFKKIHDELSPLSNAWFFNTEFLVKSEWLGKTIEELPVHWVDDNDSRVDLLQVSTNYLSEIERLAKEKVQKVKKSK